MYNIKEKLISKEIADLAKEKKIKINYNELPTQSYFQKILRDMYNIMVEVRYIDTLRDIYIFKILTTGNATRPEVGNFSTYEDALEVGLKYGIQLIK